MRDVDGQEWIDFHSCSGATLLGFNHPAIREAVLRERRQGLLHQLRIRPPRAVRRPDLADGPVRREGAAWRTRAPRRPWPRCGSRATSPGRREDHQVRGSLPRDARVRVLQLAQPARRDDAVRGDREGLGHRRHGRRDRRPDDRHPLQRHRDLREDGRGAPRRAGGGDPRAGHVQRRLHRAAARATWRSCARSPRREGMRADLRRGAVGFPHAPGLRAGATTALRPT